MTNDVRTTPLAASPLTARMVEEFRTMNLEEAEGMRHKYPEGVADECKRRINMICDAALSGIVSEKTGITCEHGTVGYCETCALRDPGELGEQKPRLVHSAAACRICERHLPFASGPCGEPLCPLLEKRSATTVRRDDVLEEAALVCEAPEPVCCEQPERDRDGSPVCCGSPEPRPKRYDECAAAIRALKQPADSFSKEKP